MKHLKTISLFLIGMLLISPLSIHAESTNKDKKVEGVGVNLMWAEYWSPQYAFNNLLMYQNLDHVKRSDSSYEAIITMEKLMWFPTVTVVADAPLKSVSLVGTEVAEWKSDREVVLRVLRTPNAQNGSSYGEHGIFKAKWDRSKPVKNLKVLVDGDRPDELFTKAFLENLKNQSCLRMMDWGKTNNSQQRDWQDRPLPGDPYRDGVSTSGKKGVPLEYMIELANQLHTDIWYCVPHMATDDYTRRAAEMLEQGLDADQHVYVELSNEVWNGGTFGGKNGQATYGAEKGKKWAPDKKNWERAQAWLAHRSYDVFKIFKSVLQDRVTTVMATQGGNWGVLDAVAKYYPDQTFESIDAISGTVYWGADQKDIKALRDRLPKEGTRPLLNLSKERVERLIRGLPKWKKYADKFNARVLAYEGGQHIVSYDSKGWSDAAKRVWIDFQTSEELAKHYDMLIEALRDSEFDLVLWYADIAPVSIGGSWGHSLNPVTHFPRRRALDQAIN